MVYYDIYKIKCVLFRVKYLRLLDNLWIVETLGVQISFFREPHAVITENIEKSSTAHTRAQHAHRHARTPTRTHTLTHACAPVRTRARLPMP